MPAFICTNCGAQYPNSDRSLAECSICLDSRYCVNPQGQTWTTMDVLQKTHFNGFRRLEPGLMGIGTFPAFAIGQRALLLRTPSGNVLWDCLSFLDDATITLVTALGGLVAIACSEPHFIASAVAWSHAFQSVPVFVHGRDRQYVPRQDAVIRYWVEDQMLLADGITLVRCGGHFPGSAVLHWSAGAGGDGCLLVGNTLLVTPDGKLTFMRSYPNMIPMDSRTVCWIADRLQPLEFKRIYGAWWDRVILNNAKGVIVDSVDRFLNAAEGTARDE